MRLYHPNHPDLLANPQQVDTDAVLLLGNFGVYPAYTVLYTHQGQVGSRWLSVNLHKDWNQQGDNAAGPRAVARNLCLPIRPRDQIEQGDLLMWVGAPADVLGQHVRPGDALGVDAVNGRQVRLIGDDPWERPTVDSVVDLAGKPVVVVPGGYTRLYQPETVEVEGASVSVPNALGNDQDGPTVGFALVEQVIRDYVDENEFPPHYAEEALNRIRREAGIKDVAPLLVQITLPLPATGSLDSADLAALVYAEGQRLGVSGLAEYVQVVTG